MLTADAAFIFKRSRKHISHDLRYLYLVYYLQDVYDNSLSQQVLCFSSGFENRLALGKFQECKGKIRTVEIVAAEGVF